VQVVHDHDGHGPQVLPGMDYRNAPGLDDAWPGFVDQLRRGFPGSSIQLEIQKKFKVNVSRKTIHNMRRKFENMKQATFRSKFISAGGSAAFSQGDWDTLLMQDWWDAGKVVVGWARAPNSRTDDAETHDVYFIKVPLRPGEQGIGKLYSFDDKALADMIQVPSRLFCFRRIYIVSDNQDRLCKSFTTCKQITVVRDSQ